MITENISTLKINKLTQAQYERELAAGRIDEYALYLTPDEVTPIAEGGTGSSNGATGLANLFAAGNTIISDYQYGDEVPLSASEGTLFFKKATGTVADINSNLLSELMLEMYPVGAIYTSTVSTSPASLFGGTWEQIKDTFLLSVGNNYAAGSTGGEVTHTLTVDELPNINGKLQFRNTSGGYNVAGVADAGNAFTFGSEDGSSWGNSISTTGTTKSADTITMDFGGGVAHNNMPPYLAVYMWKRTA